MFKIGDRVERINEDWVNMMKVGDKDIIVGIENSRSISLRRYGIGHFVDNLKLIERNKPMTIPQRIEALDDGWNKKCDDIMIELCTHGYGFDIPVSRNSLGSITLWRYECGQLKEKLREFSYHSQCSKMRAFKDALLWLYEKSNPQPKEGDKAEVSVDGKKWEAKLVREL